MPFPLPALPLVAATRPPETRAIRIGLQLAIRPLEPSDAGRLQDHVRALSRPSRYNRYLGAINELPPGEIERLVAGAGGAVRPFIAEVVAANARRMIGEMVLALDCSTGTAEFGLSVADAWQSLGVGAAMIGFMAAEAQVAGATRLVGETLRDNDAMAALARKLGMRPLRHSGDARLIRLEKHLKD
jgi:RimJ/RimL family protein N-acetyltransferase